MDEERSLTRLPYEPAPDYLTPDERRMAELIVVRRARLGDLAPSHRLYAELSAEAEKRYGIVMEPATIRDLARRSDFRTYCRLLKRFAPKVLKHRLEVEAFAAMDDYLDAREKAKVANDYKVQGQLAGDHLDRIGLNAKKEAPVVQVQTVILKSRHFDAQTLDQPTPLIESAEIVDEAPPD